MPLTEEYFDVVDAEDAVIASTTRREVHRKGLFHRAIHVFVFNEAGQLFLQRRSMTKDTAPGKWVSSCSGHVDSGEDYDTAARRELGEEIGLFDFDSLVRCFKQAPCRQTGFEFVWVYRCQAEGPFHLDPEEVSDGRWVELEALERWIRRSPRDFAWSFVFLWDAFRREAAS